MIGMGRQRQATRSVQLLAIRSMSRHGDPYKAEPPHTTLQAAHSWKQSYVSPWHGQPVSALRDPSLAFGSSLCSGNSYKAKVQGAYCSQIAGTPCISFVLTAH